MMQEPADASTQAGRDQAVEGSGAMPVTSDHQTGPVWSPLRDIWLTNTVLRGHDMACSAAYSWDASEYIPIFQMDTEGEPRMLFARAI